MSEIDLSIYNEKFTIEDHIKQLDDQIQKDKFDLEGFLNRESELEKKLKFIEDSGITDPFHLKLMQRSVYPEIDFLRNFIKITQFDITKSMQLREKIIESDRFLPIPKYIDNLKDFIKDHEQEIDEYEKALEKIHKDYKEKIDELKYEYKRNVKYHKQSYQKNIKELCNLKEHLRSIENDV